MPSSPRLALVVLISGSGSNLQAIIDRSLLDLPIDIRAVISNDGSAFGLKRARRAGIPTEILGHREYPDRASYDAALMALIDHFEPGAVALAGFMRILSPGFVDHYRGRLFNIHPSLLPKYKGLHTHQRVLEAGDTEHGASVHFVTEELDGGPVVLQTRVPVLGDDSEDRLAARVLEQEHKIYPQVLRWFAEGRLALRSGRVWFDDRVLEKPLLLEELPA